MRKHNPKAFKRNTVSLYFFIVTMVIFYLPLIILIVLSFNATKGISWDGFSLRWYNELFFKSSKLWTAFGNTMLIALLAATISTVIGTLGGIGLYWFKFRMKKYIEIASYLPLILPEIIIGISLLIFFSGIKFKLGLITILIAHITFCLPYVLFIVMARLAEFDYSIIEAAHDLGARERDTLLKIIIPVALPGVASGFLMAFTLSLDDFLITFFVSGKGSSTLPLEIYNMIRFGVSPVVNALSVILIVGSLALGLLSKKFYKYMFS